ncbi:hypothetical protein [Sphaerothrix gracilis]|uniref:hypothetical protein n=1 Tax=Sphaerothrix gracilis TaxID=3151835 RepID=UPI0031FDE84B
MRKRRFWLAGLAIGTFLGLSAPAIAQQGGTASLQTTGRSTGDLSEALGETLSVWDADTLEDASERLQINTGPTEQRDSLTIVNISEDGKVQVVGEDASESDSQ